MWQDFMPLAGGLLNGMFGGNQVQMPPQYKFALELQQALLKRAYQQLRTPLGKGKITRAAQASIAGMGNEANTAATQSAMSQIDPSSLGGADAIANITRSTSAQTQAGQQRALLQDAEDRGNLLWKMMAGAQGLASNAAQGAVQQPGADFSGIAQIGANSQYRNMLNGMYGGGKAQGTPGNGNPGAFDDITNGGDYFRNDQMQPSHAVDAGGYFNGAPMATNFLDPNLFRGQ